MDPNSSVLLMFDPITARKPEQYVPHTPARTQPTDELSMSTFFNRIGLAAPQPPVHDNRRSLIDLDNSVREIRDNKPVASASSLSEITPSPQLLPHNIFLPPSPVQEPKPLPEIRVPARDQPSRTRGKPIADKNGQNAPAPIASDTRAPRRSSLDLSALTWNLQDRLADMSFGFDLINDEMSMLSEVSDVDSAVPAFKTCREIAPISVPPTQTNFILPPLDFDPPLTSRPIQVRKVPPPRSSPPKRTVALPSFDFERTKAEDFLPSLPKSTLALPTMRKARKSVFDALENTPTTAQTPPNIVTSWSTAASSRHNKHQFKIPAPPEFKVPTAPTTASRHRRTHSSSSTSNQSSISSRSSFIAPSSSRMVGKSALSSVAGSPEAVRTTSVVAPTRESTRPPSSLEREKEKMRAARDRERERERESKAPTPTPIPVTVAAAPSLRRTRTSIIPSSSEPRSLASHTSSTTTRVSSHARTSSITRPEPRSSMAPSTTIPSSSRTLSRTTSVQTIATSARATSIVRSQSRIGVLASTTTPPTQPQSQTLRSKPSTYALRESVNISPETQQPIKTLRPRASTYSIRSSVINPNPEPVPVKSSTSSAPRPLLRTRSRGAVGSKDI